MPPSSEALARELRRVLVAARMPPGDPAGLWHAPAAPRAVRRLGLALDPPGDVAAWIERERLDALVLHRPWHLDVAVLPEDVAVLAFHLAFDERLGIGYAPVLASTLRLRGARILGRKDGRPLGMIGRVPEASWPAWEAAICETFGGAEGVWAGTRARVRTVAAVGAMNAALVAEAAARGADLYLTGQLRAGARAAVEASGMHAVGVGHARSERWALRRLGDLVARRFEGVEVVFAEPS